MSIPALTLLLLPALAPVAPVAPPSAPGGGSDASEQPEHQGPRRPDSVPPAPRGSAPVSATDRPERAGRAGRLEHFALVWRGDLVGVARHVETRGVHGPLFERETHWFDDEALRVLEVEEPQRPGPVLVWREIRRGAGRTLVLERHSSRATSITDWCGPVAPARRLLVGPQPLTPLARLASARLGRAPLHGPSPLAFQPLEGAQVALEYRVRGGPGNGPRWSVWLRPDGSEAERALFVGPVLLARRGTAGGPWSLAVDPARYQELLGEYGNRSESALLDPVTKLLPGGARPVR